MLCLFDGHGPHGTTVAEMCVEITKSEYNKSNYAENPQDWITTTLNTCNEQVCSSNARKSGSTGIIIL